MHQSYFYDPPLGLIIYVMNSKRHFIQDKSSAYKSHTIRLKRIGISQSHDWNFIQEIKEERWTKEHLQKSIRKMPFAMCASKRYSCFDKILFFLFINFLTYLRVCVLMTSELTNPKSKSKVQVQTDDWVFIKIRFSNHPASHPQPPGKVSKKQDRAILPK